MERKNKHIVVLHVDSILPSEGVVLMLPFLMWSSFHDPRIKVVVSVPRLLYCFEFMVFWGHHFPELPDFLDKVFSLVVSREEFNILKMSA